VILLVIGGLLIVGVLAAVPWFKEREPEYNGKKLSQWLDQYEFYDGPDQAQREREAANAVHQIGQRGLPWLVKWTTTPRPPDWRYRVAYSIDRRTRRLLNWSFRDNNPGFWFLDYEGELRRQVGLSGFEILGAEARPAVPELSQIAQNANRARAYSAQMALDRIGVAGPWLSALTNAAATFPPNFREAFSGNLRSDFPSLRRAWPDATGATAEREATNSLHQSALGSAEDDAVSKGDQF
jgi:hypothetical protein